jgi:two-component system, OmpR family, response regulator RstA
VLSKIKVDREIIFQMQNSSDLILLVEDDVKLAQLVSAFLIKNELSVLHQVNGLEAIETAKKVNPKLIILDVMLPGLDGLSVCRQLREFYTAPILMLTALNDDIDEVAGLEMGADGYLGKPIKPRVLLAHIRAQLRRYSFIEKERASNSTVITAGAVKIDSTKRTVWVDAQEVELTAAEFDLLWLLAENKGKILKREDLHWKVFGMEYDGFDRNIDIRISKLRRKMSDNSKHSELIKTIRGKGYILAD